MLRSITLLLIAIVAVSADSPAALFVRAANNAAALVGAPATDASNAGVAPVANADVAAVDGASQPLRRLLAKRGECTSSFDFGSQKGSCKSLDDCPKDFGFQASRYSSGGRGAQGCEFFKKGVNCCFEPRRPPQGSSYGEFTKSHCDAEELLWAVGKLALGVTLEAVKQIDVEELPGDEASICKSACQKWVTQNREGEADIKHCFFGCVIAAATVQSYQKNIDDNAAPVQEHCRPGTVDHKKMGITVRRTKSGHDIPCTCALFESQYEYRDACDFGCKAIAESANIR